MIQLIGILIVVNSFIVSSWWLATHQTWNIGFTTVATLACLTGLALVFNERAIELSFGKFGKIKAVAQQAETDAKAINEIKQRVEAQAATMDLVAKEAADAKQLLADLTKQNQIAEEKLKELSERTAEVIRLPDGRTKFGSIITGASSILEKKFELGIAAYQQNDFKTAFEHFSECVKIQEETEKQKGNIVMESGMVNTKSIADIYDLAAETAQKTGHHPLSLEWAQKSVDIAPNGMRKALLVTCLLNNKKQTEARELVDKTLKENNEESKQFRDLLVEIGVLSKPPSNK